MNRIFVDDFDSQETISMRLGEFKNILEAILNKANINTDIIQSMIKKYNINIKY
jgi:hypothetical protein